MLNNIYKKELYISDILISALEKYGAIKWHKNKNHSFYIKFKDVRLGSIRIANHKGRERYNYTYEIYTNDVDIDEKINNIVNSIINKTKTIYNFNSDKYIIFDKKDRKYKEVKTLQEYKNYIFNKC